MPQFFNGPYQLLHPAELALGPTWTRLLNSKPVHYVNYACSGGASKGLRMCWDVLGNGLSHALPTAGPATAVFVLLQLLDFCSKIPLLFLSLRLRLSERMLNRQHFPTLSDYFVSKYCLYMLVYACISFLHFRTLSAFPVPNEHFIVLLLDSLP